MSHHAPWLIVGSAIWLIFWGARSLDRFERRIMWEDVLEGDYIPPEYYGQGARVEFADTLDEIRGLPERAA